MKRFFKSARFRVMAVILAALILGMGFAAVGADRSSPLTSVVSIVYQPVQRLASFVADKLRGVGGSFVSSDVYREEVSELQAQVDRLNGRLVDYERVRQKLGAYESFLEVKEDHPDFTYVPASVVSRNSGDAFNTFTLDKGSRDGVEIDDPVVFGDSVVGIVKKVNTATCVVRTILDPELNLSVYEIRSRENGYCETTASLAANGQCRMAGLTKDTAVSQGGIVCTSGLGGLFPRDLQIGTITDIKDSPTDVSVYAVITPAADVSSVSDVFVITYFDGQHEAA